MTWQARNVVRRITYALRAAVTASTPEVLYRRRGVQ